MEAALPRLAARCPHCGRQRPRVAMTHFASHLVQRQRSRWRAYALPAHKRLQQQKLCRPLLGLWSDTVRSRARQVLARPLH